jgi:hypothetical protein
MGQDSNGPAVIRSMVPAVPGSLRQAKSLRLRRNKEVYGRPLIRYPTTRAQQGVWDSLMRMFPSQRGFQFCSAG